jgi:DNA-binding PadR family transcriptional regulator
MRHQHSDHSDRHRHGSPFGRGSSMHDDFQHERGGGRHRHGRRPGRIFDHGELRLVVLALISERPRHGYEIIKEIEDRVAGTYSPSPGVIYPTLTMLEELGHAQVTNEQGGRKLYAITDAGRVYLDENRAAVDAVTARTEHSARMAAKAAAPMAVRKAMHALKHALLMRGSDWSKAEGQRIAEILDRAASDIATGQRRD